MEEFFKFVLYAIIFGVYIVSLIRKSVKKKEAEHTGPIEREVQRKAAAPRTRPAVKMQKAIKKVKETVPERRPVVYKPIVEDEEEIAENVQKQRRKEALELKKERQALADEHLEHYQQSGTEDKRFAWLKNKQQLQKAFIASEVLGKKY